MQISLSHPPLLSTHHPPPVRHRPRCCFFVSLFFFFSSSFLSLLLPFPPSSSPHPSPSTSHHPNLNLPTHPSGTPLLTPKPHLSSSNPDHPLLPNFSVVGSGWSGFERHSRRGAQQGGVSRGARGDKIAGSIALEIADRISSRRNYSGNLGGKSRGNFRQPAGRGLQAMPSALPGEQRAGSLRLLRASVCRW